MQSQADLLAAHDPDFILLTDAGRADVFEALYPEYLTGDYQRAHNGGHRATPHWFAAHFPDTYDALLCHGGQPIHGIDSTPPYDERAHFRCVPFYTLYDFDADLGTCPPREVNRVLRAHLPDGVDVRGRLQALGYTPDRSALPVDTYVVRYLQPHVPFRLGDAHGLVADRTIARCESGEIDAEAAYRDNYRWVLGAISEVVDELPGTVVVTSDHGDCLNRDEEDCNQWFHEPGNDLHDHLVEVPFLVVD